MTEKWLELFVEFLEFFRFATVVNCYEMGVHQRRGHFYRVLEPGIRFMWPFYLDSHHTERVVPTPREIIGKSLITADGKNVTIACAIMYEIFDIKKATLEVNEVVDAVDNACQATLAEHVLAEEFKDVCTESFFGALTTECRWRAEEYGIRIISVRPVEISPVRTYRVVRDK